MHITLKLSSDLHKKNQLYLKNKLEYDKLQAAY